MTTRRDVVTDTDERLAFKHDVMDLVNDLGRLCRWVLDRPSVPIPSVDMFGSHTWWILAMSQAEFDRLADVLAADGTVEHELNERFRVVRRRFGRCCLEVTLSLGPVRSAPEAAGEGS